MKRALLGLAAVATCVLLAAAAWLAWMSRAADDPGFFEREIRAFERADRTSPPEAGSLVFVGSSSIRLWTSLARDMAPLRVVNRGFGGAHLAHVVRHAPRILPPHAPRAIVLYAGDNDIASGKTAERVLSDFEAFVAWTRRALPKARIVFLSIKPSPLRFDLWPEMRRANEAIEGLAARDPRLFYVDVASVLLDEEGRPREALFAFDGLHLRAEGYDAWTRVVAPFLAELEGPRAAHP